MEDDLCVSRPAVLRHHVDASRLRTMRTEEVVDFGGAPRKGEAAQDYRQFLPACPVWDLVILEPLSVLW